MEFSRTALLIGDEAVDKLRSSKVLIFGIGGVGSYVAEAAARAGIGQIDIVDDDTVSVSNINRQIIALHSTVGRYKVDVMKERMRDINEEVVVNEYRIPFNKETAHLFDFSQYDYIVDAIDTITSKLLIATMADELKIRLISSMGVGNKLHPEQLEIADIYKTSVCPLAKTMRRELRKRDIKRLKVLYSKEEPIRPVNSQVQEEEATIHAKRQTPGSISFVPSAAGLIIAGEMIRDIINID